jgi:N-acetylmuramoyl-L-alanine amidase
MQRAAQFPMMNPMPSRRARRIFSVAAIVGVASTAWCAGPQYGSGRTGAFAHAERMREALEGRPEQQKTRLQYERVLDAYRAIYHSDPASPKADASIAAVADLLAEEGRVFQDAKLLRDAIGQYEFLRKQYPASRYRASALLTEGEIQQRDFGDLDAAKAVYLNFLHVYPESPLALEARVELKNIRQLQLARRGSEPRTRAAQSGGAAASGRKKTILTAAIQSQAPTARSTPPPNTLSPTSTANSPSAASTHGATGPAAVRTPGRGASQGAGQSARIQENDIPALAPPEEGGTGSRNTAGATIETPAAADLNAAPPPPRSRVPLITGIRHWSTPVYTRVAIDLQQEVRYTAARVPGPDRIFFDLYGTRLSPELVGHSLEVTDDGFLSRIRVVQYNNVVRLVLDVNSVSDYSAFFLSNPSRLIIDVHGQRPGTQPLRVARSVPPPMGIGPEVAQPTANAANPQNRTAPIQPGVFPDANTVRAGSAQPDADLGTSAGIGASANGGPRSPLADVATLSTQPNEVRATKRPTTAPVVASVAGTTPAPQPADEPDAVMPKPRRSTRSAKPSAARAADDVPPAEAGAPGVRATDSVPAGPAEPASGATHATSSMMRALGLKINRIVIDAGHGGHDSGTLGPGGLEEKDVVLDVALRLGKLLKQRLGAEVIYTRSDDTFIPLETRTAIANQAQADLFISVHGNSSPDSSARGVEVYYLNFTSSADALEVAARENAVSNESIHQLSDLVKKIALQDKISESREFAEDVDQSLYAGLEEGNAGLKDRGVKKAPFVVLIGANMPSILAEISFVTNPNDAQELRDGAYRERIAESLYRGVARYVSSMNGMRVAAR